MSQSTHGSFTLSLAWSCCVDMQVTGELYQESHYLLVFYLVIILFDLALLFLLVKIVSWVVDSKSGTKLANILEFVFGA